MYIQSTISIRGITKFFRIGLGHDNLENMYLTNFAMMQHHNYNLQDLENMIPFEREIYVTLLSDHVKEENERIKSQQKNTRL